MQVMVIHEKQESIQFCTHLQLSFYPRKVGLRQLDEIQKPNTEKK